MIYFHTNHYCIGLEKNGESTSEGLPTIYMMDCTANECHQLLKLAGKVENNYILYVLNLFHVHKKTLLWQSLISCGKRKQSPVYSTGWERSSPHSVDMLYHGMRYIS
jgi:hypothetical protein